MIASERTVYILRRLAECGIIDYKNISRELGVSEATVRRDFEKLERSGKLRRVQGGAVSSEEERPGELSILAKHNVNTGVKAAVAAAAAREVQPGECVFLDMGTSIAPLGRALLQMSVRIITNNNLILQSVTPSSPAEIHIIGGQFDPADQMFGGAKAEEMLAGFAFHRAFLGCMGLDPVSDAVYVTDTVNFRIKQIAMQNARESILLADSSKCKKVGLFRLCGMSDFDRIYMEESGIVLPGESSVNLISVPYTEPK